MDQTTVSLEIAIHGTVTRASNHSLGYGVDAGPLLWALCDEPARVANLLSADDPDGTIELHAVRTHEWELVVDIILAGIGAGAAIFCTAALEEMGKTVGAWAVKQLGLGDGSSNPVAEAGGTEVVIPRSDPTSAETDLVGLIDAAARKNVRVTIILDPENLS